MRPSDLLIATLLFSSLLISCGTDSPPGKLSEALHGFENPQDSARTKTWWFHGETETTKEGITADLEAYKRVGIGGVVYYDQSHGNAENALPGFSPEWWEMLRFSAEEAERLGLDFEVHISNGFVAGGEWITEEHSMKRLAATETTVRGGQQVEITLDVPTNRYGFSKDIAVLAFPAPAGGGRSSLTESVRMTSRPSGPDIGNIFDPTVDVLTTIPVPRDGKPVYIDLEFDDVFTARSITYEVAPRGKATTSATNVPAPPQDTFVGTGYRILPDLGQLEVSEDGVSYRKVCDLKPVYRAHESWRQKTVSFPAARGRYYRLNLNDWWEEDRLPMQIGRVVLNSVAKTDQWEEKAGFYSEYIEADRTPEYSREEAVDPALILNITDRMDDNGLLRWDAPEGDWIVMRFACVLTGGSTKHGRKNLLGRECDKMSVAVAEFHWQNYVGRIIDSLRASGSGKLAGVAMDSHEAGSQNWTDDFIEEFSRRQGYDPTLFLPAMMGYVVGDIGTSDGFLYDVRRNIADMIADNYYGTLDRLCRENGLVLTAQATGNALCIVADPIMAKSRVAKPQGEFWPIHPDGNYDIKESSSSAHLYGKHIASAEAYTDAKYSHSPADLKTLADYAYAYGINEFVICASAYQPWLDRVPGNTGGGRHYCINRNNTWWDYSAPFWDYQARCAYIMRVGKPAIGLCVYLGENAPVKILTHRLPDIPGGYDFDAFTSDALLERMSADGSRIVLPDGTDYKMMILSRNGEITFDALWKIASMVDKGMRVYGPKPVGSPSGRDTGKEAEYARLSDEIWGETPAPEGWRSYGKGTVYWGMPLSDALDLAGVRPDITMAGGNTKDNMVYFAHRRVADGDIYFLANRKDTPEQTAFTFSARGKYAQLWNPVTGERRSVPATAGDGGTVAQLYMNPRESFFIVITDNREELPPVDWYTENCGIRTVVDGPWHVRFDPQWGGPGEVVFDGLHDWTLHEDPRIRYYSGTAVYRKTVDIDPAADRIFLDLGDPGFVARVFVNGQEAGVVWCSPWCLDITGCLRAGQNELEIHVANSLMNRMIYDESLPWEERVTYAYPSVVSPDDTPVESGLRQVILVRK
ncbi:MAG: glycosyl hydrolase family 2 [Rikenellaceae bacterium]|nr:glycosyl hydrolase family 2 [Rikenellaceae bacterium]